MWQHSLRTRLSLSFALVTLVCVCLASIMANIVMEGLFRQYKIHTHEEKSREIVYWLGQQYGEDESWDTALVESIGMSALERGLIIKLSDESGRVIWDAATHNDGMCKEMLDQMADYMLEHYPDWNSRYIVDPYPVSSGNKTVGRVEIGYYGPFYYDENDMFFISTLNKLLLCVGALSLIFSLVLGAFMSKRISNPITRAVAASRKIAGGYYNDRITAKSNIHEISQLTATVNDLAETLKKQEILRKQLTTNVAHELRTPLSTLQSHFEAMMDGIWKPDAGRLGCCHRELLRIIRMVGDLEKLSRYDKENTRLNMETYDVSEQIRNLAVHFEPEFRKNGISLTCSGESQEIFADRDKIEQVLINLLSNALKYSAEDGRVEISAARTGDTVVIVVKDNGIGIGKEDLPFIFERFYRVDKSRSRDTGGSGIGLTIARAIADAHGGTIAVSSEPGTGSEFVLQLPASTR